VRAVQAYEQEPSQIDVVMYRITDSRYADAMIAAVQRGVKVRLLTEPKQYRDPIRQYHSYNVDRMYMAGVEIRHRAHAGLNHQKSVLLRGLGQAIFGSSNWSSASSESQEEHNLFTDDPTIYDWLTAQFERKWNNLAPVAESAPFAPQPPDVPTSPSPASGASGVAGASVTLEWYPGFWAHTYDVYLGTDPFSLPRVAADLPLGPSRFAGDMKTFTTGGSTRLGSEALMVGSKKAAPNASRPTTAKAIQTVSASTAKSSPMHTMPRARLAPVSMSRRSKRSASMPAMGVARRNGAICSTRMSEAAAVESVVSRTRSMSATVANQSAAKAMSRAR
jgi:hypothetical protein